MAAWVNADHLSPPFKDMEEIAVNNKKICTLRKCNGCAQHWQVDEYEKYREGICIKIDDPEQWLSFDDMPFREKKLIINYNGLSNKTCAWSECSNKALKDIVYCPACALTHMKISS